MRWALLLYVLGIVAWTTPSCAAEIEQTTTGSYSPAIIGNNNQVIIGDIDPRALKRMNDELDAKDLQLKQKIQEAEEWAEKYREVNQQLTEARRALAAKGEDTTLVQAAQDLLHEGKLEEAGKIVDQLLVNDETNIDRAAQDNFNRASIYALQFQPTDALPFYAKAYRYRPENSEYFFGYYSILFQQRDFRTAETVLNDYLIRIRELAVKNPDRYRLDLAITLIDLGSLYSNTQRLSEAESASREAAAIMRELVAQDPDTHRPYLARALSNLGNIYTGANRFAEAESAYKEAAAIRRELVVQNPNAYRQDLTITLNNLGILYTITHRLGEAESTLKEAAAIMRERPKIPAPTDHTSPPPS